MGKVVMFNQGSLATKVDVRNDDWSNMVRSINKKNTYNQNFNKEYIKAYMKLLSK